ncbi:MAG: hypothetical protein K0R89_1943 [Ramlibacter sp.]|nr:hypothetical protein [Ramlibacter sp.]
MGMAASVTDYRAIAAAVRSGEAQACERLVADHVDRAHERLAAQQPTTKETRP